MSKVKYIKNSSKMPCRRCNGKGCKDCDNGIYEDKRFILIAQNTKGEKIAFDVDQGK